MQRHPPSFERGYILLLSLVFLSIFVTVSASHLGSITSYAKSERVAIASAQARALAEAGFDKAVYELNQNTSYTGETGTALGAGVFTVGVETLSANAKRVTVTASVPNAGAPIAEKTVAAELGIDTSTVSFYYGVQVGAGGVTFGNNSRVSGSLYANGSITGSGTVTGSATAAGASTLSGVTVEGDARARTLSNCSIGDDAVYQTISNCSVGGTETATTTDASPAAFPIDDEQIEGWKDAAAAGSVINGNYTLNYTQQLGPHKINGNLTVGGTLMLSGPVWVNGNITFSNNARLTIASGLGNNGAVLIADSTNNPSGQGAITLSNNVTVSGNGSPNSYPMVLSMKTSGTAITLSNNSDSVILYAPYARVSVDNNGTANQITAYGLTLSNNSIVLYLNGMQDASFSDGPGGSWAFIPGTYSLK